MFLPASTLGSNWVDKWSHHHQFNSSPSNKLLLAIWARRIEVEWLKRGHFFVKFEQNSAQFFNLLTWMLLCVTSCSALQWWSFEDKGQLLIDFFSKISSRKLISLTFKCVVKKCWHLISKSILCKGTVFQNSRSRLVIGFDIWLLKAGQLCLNFINKGQFLL